jgi:hypothetical protein
VRGASCIKGEIGTGELRRGWMSGVRSDRGMLFSRSEYVLSKPLPVERYWIEEGSGNGQ